MVPPDLESDFQHPRGEYDTEPVNLPTLNLSFIYTFPAHQQSVRPILIPRQLGGYGHDGECDSDGDNNYGEYC